MGSFRLLILYAFFALTFLRGAQCDGPADIERAIRNSPSANAYNALGAYFAEHKQFACATPAFEKALQLEPNSWETHFNFGLALMENHDPGRAATEFRASVKLKPDSVRARNGLGTALQAGGRLEEAESEFRVALKLDPKSVDTLDRLAQVYSAERRYAPAIEKLKRGRCTGGRPTRI